MTKFLNISTDNTLGGNAPSDVVVSSQKAIKDYVDQHSGGGADIDNSTITTNAQNKIQAVAVVDQNTGIVKTWTGTAAEYEAIATKDPDTEYIITDDIGGNATDIGQITEDINDLKEHTVIEFQTPTADNNYTWYRKYADGWVEQGGYIAVLGQRNTTITLPVEMADTNYVVQVTNDFNDATNQYGSQCNGRSTTQIIIKCGSYASGDQIHANWQVSGMAA